MVTLTQDATWVMFQDTGTGTSQTRTWNPFIFSPTSVPGFSDYQATYSHFRILKAKLYISRTIGGNNGLSFNYLVVGSRPFAATQAVANGGSGPAQMVPPQEETALRQSKWQKIHYPNNTSLVVTAGFYPYTMIQTNGPAAPNGNYSWQRIWEAKKWMPFVWAGGGNAVGSRSIAFYGPYMVIDSSSGELPGAFTGAAVECTLKISVQFKGQR